MLQVFCLDDAKIDLDVVYTCMLQAYVSIVFRCFYTYVYKCFIRMLHMCVMVFQVFSQVFQTLVLSVSSVFFCILSLLHLDVSKVDWVLHMGCACEAAGSADDVWDGVGDVRGGAGPLPVCSLASPTC